MALNGNASAAHRMAEAVLNAEAGRAPLYFHATGQRILPGGRSFRSVADDWAPQSFALVVEHPFRPSAASCGDMIAEHALTGHTVTYDEARWEADPRISEQAGPSVTEDWKLEQRVAA